MSHHPDDRTQGEPPDPDRDPSPQAEGEDFHPAIDPREPLNRFGDEPRPTAPPVDIDDRDGASAIHTQPEVIELSEHVDDDPQSTQQELVDHEPDDEPDDDAPSTDASADGTEPDAGDPGTEEPARLDSGPSTASSWAAGAAGKLGLGSLMGSKGASGPSDTGAAEPGQGTPEVTFSRSRSKLADNVRSYLDPRLHMFSTIPHRRLLAAGAVLILVSLLANSGGLALIVLSAVAPILILITLTQHDVFEKESNLLLAAVTAGGAVVGILLSLLASWIQASQWFDDGVLNFGAAGFGGRFADEAGSAPFIVWFMVGLLLPAVAIAGIAGIPIAMRRWPQFRNEVMDGVILAGASAAGFSIGASIVYWWPMIAEPGPQTNVSDWTLSIIGVAVLRSAVITLCGAMIGAGIWRYMVTPAASLLVLPAVGGVVGYLLLTFGSIQLQAAGNWPEFLWIALLLAAVFMLYRRVLDQAVVTDRRALGADEGRLVCPSCHKVTPPGAFCARCGKPLPRSNQRTSEPVEAPVEAGVEPGGTSG